MPHDFHADTAYAESDAAWARARQEPRQRIDPCAEDCTPRCPACEGLKCLCRPRFFPGQLLTDDDLNRLQQYVIDKNRLHNRYVQDWGVACGLEVVCDACDGGHVRVRTGYAVSPCGDDIVVCNDQSVDMCALIHQCGPKREPICDPPSDRPPRDCGGKARNWVLAICYDERPSRGITAQLGMQDSRCGNRCACGGSGGCGCNGGSDCGCGGNGGAKTSAASGGCGCGGASATDAVAKSLSVRKKPYAPQCEPTQVCEGYRFVAYPAPPPASAVDVVPGTHGVKTPTLAWLYANRARLGPLLERVLCCTVRAMEFRGALREPDVAVSGDAALQMYADYAAALRDFTADFGLHRCAFVRRAADQYDEAKAWIDAQRAERAGLSDARLVERLFALDRLWLDVVAECLCSALLPACPAPAQDNCVPLAVVTIDPDTCRVVQVCNWEARKLMITWRTVLYWLSWLPWGRLRAWIADICCGDGRDRGAYQLLTVALGVAFDGLQAQVPRPAAADAAASTKTAREASTFRGALASRDLLGRMLSDFDGLKAGRAMDAAYPDWVSMAARVVDPQALAPAATRTNTTDDIDALRSHIDELRSTLATHKADAAKQNARIKDLERRIG